MPSKDGSASISNEPGVHFSVDACEKVLAMSHCTLQSTVKANKKLWRSFHNGDRGHSCAVKQHNVAFDQAIMGNAFSEEEDGEFLEDGFNLDSPEADKQINFGTAAPNCQPKHTAVDDEREEGQEVAMVNKEDDDDKHMSAKHRRDSSGLANDDRRKRQHTQPKKLSYIQMAKLGYQELVNAIIRPPRADYKVCMRLRMK